MSHLPSLPSAASAAPAVAVPDDAALDALAPAPHVRRALAWTIDLALAVLVVASVHRPFPLALPIAFLAVYHGLCVWLTGQTLGKALTGLEVRRAGAQPGLLWALTRSSLGYYGVDLLGLGLLLALRDPRHRTLHDAVWRSRVVVVETGRLDLKTASRRSVAFLERHGEALKERKGLLAAVAAFLAWNLALAKQLDRLLGFLWRAGGGHAPAAEQPSLLHGLSLKAQALLAAATTTASAAVVVAVPPVGDAARWLLEPRFDGAGSEFAGTWQTTDFRQFQNDRVVSTEPLPAATWTLTRTGDGYVLEVGAVRVTLSPRDSGAFAGSVDVPGLFDCVDTEPPHNLTYAQAYRTRNSYAVSPGTDGPSFEIAQRSTATAAAVAAGCPQHTSAVYRATGTRAA